MARETKVGLLAGLAFIICFAIILANRGGYEPSTTHLPYVVDSGDNASQAARSPGAPVANHRVAAVGDGANRVAQTQDPVSIHRPVPVRADHVRRGDERHGPASSGASVPFPQPDAASLEGAVPDARNAVQPRHAMSQSPTSPSEGSSLTSRSRRRAQQRVLQERLDSLAAHRADNNTQARSTHTPGTRNHPSNDEPQSSLTTAGPASVGMTPQPARYTVVSGDTLSTIAARHYGRRSMALVKAIFEANRGVLSSPDLLKVGMELKLPVVEGFASGSEQTVTGSARASAATPQRSHPASEQSNATGLTWYQIKKNDRYIGIAREQLGNASRWREIYELNKDKFPDPGRIREGVRIRLPDRTVRVAAGTQH